MHWPAGQCSCILRQYVSIYPYMGKRESSPMVRGPSCRTNLLCITLQKSRRIVHLRLVIADWGLTCHCVSMTAGNACCAHAFFLLHREMHLTLASSYQAQCHRHIAFYRTSQTASLQIAARTSCSWLHDVTAQPFARKTSTCEGADHKKSWPSHG